MFILIRFEFMLLRLIASNFRKQQFPMLGCLLCIIAVLAITDAVCPGTLQFSDSASNKIKLLYTSLCSS